MWKTFSLTSLVVSIILVYPVTQSHSFDLEEWIPSFDWIPSAKSVKEALTTEAECVEVFDDGSESASITCTPRNNQQGLKQTQQSRVPNFLKKTDDCVEVFDDSLESSSITCTPRNNRQGLKQTQQQTQKTQQRVQQPISRQTQQQARQARKALPSTLISCKEQKHVWNGKKNHELKKVTHQYSIDHNKKRIRSIGKTPPWQTVLEFSDHLIKVERVNKKKTRIDTMAIDRVTGVFDEQRVISNERAFKLFGKPGILKVSGSCNKIAVTPKF
jgi:hypothetical protein